jgi:hypothetical protein
MARRSERPKNLPWWVEILVAALLALGTAVYLQATHDDKALRERVSAVEAAQTGQKDTIDHIQTQVDKLVEWALGHK